MIDGDERGCGGVVVFTRCGDSRERQEAMMRKSTGLRWVRRERKGKGA